MRSDADFDPKNYVASVEKALKLLELFREGVASLTISEIVERGGYSRTATYRLLGTLVHLGWMIRSGEKYQLSLRAFQLGSAAVNALRLRDEATAIMSGLVAATGETVYLMAPDGLRAVCLERLEGSSPVRLMVLEVGKSFPIYVGGGALALLAHRPDLLSQLAEGPLAMPSGALLDHASLQAMLEDTRRRGYSRSVEDVTEGVAAFGVPVFDNRGTAVAAISIGGMARTLVANEHGLAQALMAAGQALSRKLGFGLQG